MQRFSKPSKQVHSRCSQSSRLCSHAEYAVKWAIQSSGLCMLMLASLNRGTPSSKSPAAVRRRPETRPPRYCDSAMTRTMTRTMAGQSRRAAVRKAHRTCPATVGSLYRPCRPRQRCFSQKSSAPRQSSQQSSAPPSAVLQLSAPPSHFKTCGYSSQSYSGYRERTGGSSQVTMQSAPLCVL